MANTELNTKAAKNQKFQNQPTWKAIAICFLVIGAVAFSQTGFGANVAKAAATPSLFPTGIGSFDLWTANVGTKVDAVASNDGDATFISSTSTASDAQTFSFPGAAVPAGATINSVTLTAQAKVDSSYGELQLLAENGINSVANKPGSPNTVSNTASYAPVTWNMATNPITHAAWTVADVNSWAMNFGVANVSAFFGAKVSQLSLTVDYTVTQAPVANPTLSDSCGLDIALVVDTSGSIKSGNMSDMKTALTNFVNAFGGTPTDFSLVSFNTNSILDHAFPMTPTQAAAAIAGLPLHGSGSTNWDSGLERGFDSFLPSSAKPHLIIIATDGSPNRYGYPTVLGSGEDWNLGLFNAIDRANSIKTGGTRIVVIGIGNDTEDPATLAEKLQKMEDISGSVVATAPADITVKTDVIKVSDFSGIGDSLASFASRLCGGTITVSKKLDADGNLQTTTDQTNGGTGFTFDITPGHTGQVTDANGQTPAVPVTPGTYTVVETNIPSGYAPLGGDCSATNNGIATSTGSGSSASGTMVSGITVGVNDIVACTFYNQPPNGGGGGSTSTPSSTDVSIIKTADKATANAGDTVKFTLVVKNNGPDNATGVVASDTLPSTVTFVSSTSTQGSYNSTTSLWSIGNMLSGASATTTITATINSGTVGQTIVNTAVASSTSIDLNSGNNSSTASVTVNSPGNGGGGGASADLNMIKTVNNSTPNPGDTIIYTIVVSNLGPDLATSVTATDTLPSTVTFVSSTSTQGSYNSTTSLWSIGNLLSGASATTTITATVNSGTAGQSISNSASVTAVTFDPNLSNNTSSAGSNVPNPSTGGGGTSTGGGGGGGGGGSSGGGVVPQGQVSSTSTGASNLQMPKVLGESTQLPRTGMPVGFTFLIFGTVLALLDKKFKLV